MAHLTARIRRFAQRAVFFAALLISCSAYADPSPYPDRSVLVIATPGYPWAAADVSKVLGMRATPVDMGLAEAADVALEDPKLLGVVEVEINVAQFYETVYAICRDKHGKEIWREKRMLNFGGGPERLARDMVAGLLKKVKGKKCPE